MKDGTVIAFQRARLTHAAGAQEAEGEPQFRIAGERLRTGRRPKKGTGETKPRRERARSGDGANALFEALRAWRLAEAKRAGVPAFRIVNDRTLLGVAAEAPGDEGALLRVAGVGPGIARRYGAELLSIVAHHVRQ